MRPHAKCVVGPAGSSPRTAALQSRLEPCKHQQPHSTLGKERFPRRVATDGTRAIKKNRSMVAAHLSQRGWIARYLVLAILSLLSSIASSQTIEFCTSNSSGSQCFQTLAEAEAFMRQEPPLGR